VINNQPGVIYDQVLAWAWVNSVNTTVTIFDLRAFPVDGRFRDLDTAVAGLMLSVANVGALPSSGNWPGRRVWVVASSGEYVWGGMSWAPEVPDWVSWSTPPSGIAVGTGGGALSMQRYKLIDGRVL